MYLLPNLLPNLLPIDLICYRLIPEREAHFQRIAVRTRAIEPSRRSDTKVLEGATLARSRASVKKLSRLSITAQSITPNCQNIVAQWLRSEKKADALGSVRTDALESVRADALKSALSRACGHSQKLARRRSRERPRRRSREL